MMKKVSLFLLMLVLCKPGFSQNATPRQLYPGLFEAVQLSDLFPDSKTFVDATGKRDPKLIVADYNSQKDKPGFDLKRFVSANFNLPAGPSVMFTTDVSAGVRAHIDTLWKILYRKPDSTIKYSSLLTVPNGFIIPGGRFRETYYWDTYFTMLGLQESHKTAVIQGMVDNFSYLLNKYGFIPNGTRTYYLTRSQPPFFCLMLALLAEDKGNVTYIKYQPQLLNEYGFWMKGTANLKPGNAYRNGVCLQNGVILNRYWDESDQPREESYKKDVDAEKLTSQLPGDFYRNIRAAAESGWDFSSRWFGKTGTLQSIQTTNIIPVDLNCLLYQLELTIAHSYQLQGDVKHYKLYSAKAEVRKKAILTYCWDENPGWFMDYNWKLHHQSPYKTLAGVFPLTFKIASAEQASKAAIILKKDFLKPGGLVTTLNRSGQQWDSPNAWAPLQYMAITGLNRYKISALAENIARTWIKTNVNVFNTTGKLMEKYNVVDTNVTAGGGEYPLQDGFGWTNGILLNLMDHYPDKKMIFKTDDLSKQ